MDQDEALEIATNSAAAPVSQAEIDKVISIIEKSTSDSLPTQKLAEEHNGKWRNIANFIERHRKKVIWAAIVFSAFLGVLIPLRSIVPDNILFPIALIVGLLAEIFGISIMLSEILVAIPALYQLKKSPFKFFFNQLRSTTTFDLKMVADLSRCDRAAVRYVAKHYQYHRAGLEKRGGILSGNIDKLGLFPAIGAALLLWGQLSASSYGSWGVWFVPVIFIFHLMNLYSFSLQQRMDRVIAGLEFSMASSK